MIRVAWKGLAARPVRTALTTLAIVVGVAFVCAAYTLTDTMRGAADKLSASAYNGTDAVVVAKTSFNASQTEDIRAQAPTVPASVLEKVRATPGVQVATGDITDTAQIIGRNGKPVGSGPYFGTGFDAHTRGGERLTPFRLTTGRWATGSREVVVDQATADKEHYKVGETVRVTTRGAATDFTLTGIASFAGVKSLGTATVAVFDLDAAETLFAKDGYDRILVAGHVVGRSLAGAIGQHAQIKSAAADDRFTFDSLKTFISIIRTILLVFAGVAVLVGGFTIFNSLSTQVAARTREFGLLRMVGATRGQVRRGVLVEALVIGGLAGAAGVGVGVALALGLNALFAAVGLDLPQIGIVLAARTVIASLLVGTLATVAAAMIPARRATKVAPVAALRDAAGHSVRVKRFARFVRGVASVVGRPAVWIGGAAGVLARRNAMRNPGRTAGTAAALMIGVALVTAVTVVAKGLDGSSRGSLADRVHASAVITGVDGWSPIDPQVQAAAASAPGVKATTSIRQDGALVLGAQETVNAVDPATIARLFGDGALAKAGDGAVVGDDYATKHGLTIGDTLTLTSLSLFGIVNTLVLSTFERMRELGTLRALGMDRRQVRRMVRHESVITALIGAVLGIAVGLALAGGLTAWLGKYGFSFAIPAGSLLAVAVIAALAGMAAAALPARRASRVNVLAYE